MHPPSKGAVTTDFFLCMPFNALNAKEMAARNHSHDRVLGLRIVACVLAKGHLADGTKGVVEIHLPNSL